MIKDEIRNLIAQAISSAQQDGTLPRVPVPEIVLEYPPSPDLGDYATSIALRMARAARTSPMAVAGAISSHLELTPAIAAVKVAAPGFINFFLSSEWLQGQIEEIQRAGAQYGQVPVGNGERVQVEFVSANPTGPLHVGTGRNAALGDSLANVLQMAGYDVQREYYVNDHGSRVLLLGQSVYARYAQLQGRDVPMPDDGYPGEYVIDIARQVLQEHGPRFLEMPRQQAELELGDIAMQRVLEWVREDLERLGVRFDRWYSERSLYESKLFDRVLDILRERGYVAEREGAVWFVASELGEDKDNVIIRSNGVPTYFASDIAYHYDKFCLRHFQKVIDVWAADHQGHVPRMKAAVKALGVDPDRLTILIYQKVRLIKDGKPWEMGKRTGVFVTLQEALDAVGADPIRFFLVSRSPEAMMDFDLDLATEQSDKNPVYYVQYAHARICSILRFAGERGIDYADGDVRLLVAEPELTLIRRMVRLPEMVESAARSLSPHPLPFYAQDVASAFHSFYRQCRVVGDDVALSKARLKLVAACKQVLANTLRLIGVSAPEEMRRLEEAN